MKPINSRSGHGIGPSSNDTWYVKLIWIVMVGVIAFSMWISDAWNYLLEMFKI